MHRTMPQDEWLVACGNLAVLWWQLQLAGLEDLDDLQTLISTARIFLEEHKAPDAAAAELSELAKELDQDAKLAEQLELGAKTLDPEMSIHERLTVLIGEWSQFQAVEETVHALEMKGDWSGPHHRH